MDINKISALVKGTVEGNGSVDITGVSGIETAKPGNMTFAVDEAYLAAAEKSLASCILTSKDMRKSSKPLIRVDNPKLAFLIIYNAIQSNPHIEGGIHPTAVISKTAKIGKNVKIGPYSVIEDETVIADNVDISNNVTIRKNCSVGSYCVIHPNVTIYPNTILQTHVILHSGVVIGADGFGYVTENNAIYKFPQLGRVIIEDNVEIGANTTIDRGALNNTVIGAGTKIDNLCQIAHNVKIGKNVIMAAQCGVSGSCTIKNNVLIGGQVGIADNVTIGENARLGAQCGIIGDVDDNETMWGSPARPMANIKRQLAVLAWVTKNFKTLSKLLPKERS